MKIEAIISAEGEVKIEVHDAQGAECEQATEELEKALGKVTKRTRKREYYQARQAQERKQTT
jgi:Protein of unknown function (DUF2997)